MGGPPNPKKAEPQKAEPQKAEPQRPNPKSPPNGLKSAKNGQIDPITPPKKYKRRRPQTRASGVPTLRTWQREPEGRSGQGRERQHRTPELRGKKLEHYRPQTRASGVPTLRTWQREPVRAERPGARAAAPNARTTEQETILTDPPDPTL